jgi:hypothetical protein
MSQRQWRVMNSFLLGGLAVLLSLMDAATPAFSASRQAQEKAAPVAIGSSILTGSWFQTPPLVFVSGVPVESHWFPPRPDNQLEWNDIHRRCGDYGIVGCRRPQEHG